ncbi:MAG: polyphosphate kinase 2 [Alphaproteobacteria bacterium]
MPKSQSSANVVALKNGRKTKRVDYPYKRRMPRAEYEDELGSLQVEMLRLQAWVKERGERLVLVFEGRDGAGKGGTIKRLVEHLNPRGAHVIALDKPSDVERGQWYFQRYVKHLPAKGEIIFFDRSWYNRAGVERVMGFANQRQFEQFMAQVPQLERMWVDDGIRLFKFFLSIDKKEQRKRVLARSEDRLKHWKLSPIDLRSTDLYEEYTKARNDMLRATNTEPAPWTVVLTKDKRRGRINVFRHLLRSLPYSGRDLDTIKAPDPKILGGPGLLGIK